MKLDLYYDVSTYLYVVLALVSESAGVFHMFVKL